MKHIIRLTLFVLICLCTFTATASTCDVHSYIPPAEPQRRIGQIDYSTSGHTIHYEELTVCYVCGARNWVTASNKPTETSNHDFTVQQRDLGHFAGYVHRYVMGCSFTDCPYTTTIEVFCDDLCESWINRKRPTEVVSE